MRCFKHIMSLCCALLMALSAQSVAANPVTNQIVGKEQLIQWLVNDALLHQAPVPMWQGAAVRVGYARHKLVPGKNPNVVVVNKVATYWVSQPHRHGRIRITVPVRYYLSSWDVQALERELERLGIKVKPRPMPPKPGPVSG